MKPDRILTFSHLGNTWFAWRNWRATPVPPCMARALAALGYRVI